MWILLVLMSATAWLESSIFVCSSACVPVKPSSPAVTDCVLSKYMIYSCDCALPLSFLAFLFVLCFHVLWRCGQEMSDRRGLLYLVFEGRGSQNLSDIDAHTFRSCGPAHRFRKRIAQSRLYQATLVGVVMLWQVLANTTLSDDVSPPLMIILLAYVAFVFIVEAAQFDRRLVLALLGTFECWYLLLNANCAQLHKAQ